MVYHGSVLNSLSLGTGANLAAQINTGPNGVTVDYECWYLTTVSVDSADFNVEPITIIGEKSNTGNLADGFAITVGPSPIILGEVVDVTTTWNVAISVVSFHYESCTVVQGTISVNIIKVSFKFRRKIIIIMTHV